MKKMIDRLMDYNTALDNDARCEIAEQIEDMAKVVEAVAHIGVDFGYGSFQLGKDDIRRARELCD